ncbi:23051_t:CDS:1, partial [Gigaspora margarita]
QQTEGLEFEEDSDTDIQQTLSDYLHINQIVDLTLPAFLLTNNALFELANNRVSSYERAYNTENSEYDPISLAQQIIEEENNEFDI